MKNSDRPDVLAVVPLLTPQDRTCREIVLARLMLVGVDLVVAGEGLGLESGRDLIREIGIHSLIGDIQGRDMSK